jgi:PAS domain S-box-containing protein
MLQPWIVILCSLVYIGILFTIARYGDIEQYAKKLRPHRAIIYSLSLAVYCTSWTYYGAVGSAASSGWRYLAIYLGPTLLFVFGYQFLKKIATTCSEQNITSIADFIASRYGKSRFLAIVVTVIAITGTLPYIALQLKAIASSFEVLTQAQPQELITNAGEVISNLTLNNITTSSHTLLSDTGFIVATVMTLFCIFFGTRYVHSSEHHEGLILAIAFESLVKFFALAFVALLAVFIIIDSPADLMTKISEANNASKISTNTLANDLFTLTFVSNMVLAMAAIFCLPRQFHVTFVEITNVNHLKQARWVFPLYLLLTAVLVIPIAIAGTIAHSSVTLPALANPDMYVLTLPISYGNNLLAMFAFIGGFSAATGMAIVAVITLSTMVCNDIVMPLLFRFQSLKLKEYKDLTGLLLLIRRISIVCIFILGYLYYQYINRSQALASIGLTAFVAAIQFAPALIAAVYWKNATRRGAIAGLLSGFGIWLYTLFIPTVISGAGVGTSLLDEGPWGIGLLRPNNLFGIDFLDPTTHSLLFSLSINVICFIVFSWQRKPGLVERIQAANFTQTATEVDTRSQALPWWSTVAVGELRLLAEKFVGVGATKKAFEDYTNSHAGELIASKKADADLVHFTERLLGGAIGASSAKVIITSVINKQKDLPLEDVFSIVDENYQALQFSQGLLQTTIEHIEQGISVIDENFKIVAWNSRYLEIYDYPKNFIKVGLPVADIIRHNALKGECGEGMPEEHIEKRINFMRTGSIHSFQRYRADGTVLQIQGRPLPGGGFVTSFTDITEHKKIERELRDTNENLEQLVTGRTKELSQVNDKLQQVNRSKTRFLAAVNHDVMQPLNAARLFTAALERSDPNQKQLTNRINSSLNSAEEIIKTLIDISKLDSGSIKPTITDFHVNDVLSTLHKEFAVIADNKELELSMVPCSLVITSDAHLLRRILQNLIANALRYTKAGGHVLFGCRRIYSNTDKPSLKISVLDTGVGIPNSELSAIFEEFHQLDNQTTEETKGVGLGLSIAKRIGQTLKHPIYIESTLGKGSVFSLVVPISDKPVVKAVAAPTSKGSVATIATPIAGLKVLCVDNDKNILDAMRTLLERWGCHPYCAESLEAALLLCEKQSVEPDIMLVDCHISRTEKGIDVMQALEKQFDKKIPGVMITADVSEDIINQAENYGYAYLSKPVKPTLLRKTIQKVMNVEIR